MGIGFGKSNVGHYARLEELFGILGKASQVCIYDLEFFRQGTAVGIVYITDMDTNRIYWMNENAKAAFGGDRTGEKCYEVFQHLNEVCSFCTNDIIRQQPYVPYQWVFYNKTVKRIYLINDIFIPYKNGEERNFRYELAIDITDSLDGILQLVEEYKDE